MEHRSKRRYLGLAILMWGGGTIYNLPFIRYILYEPLREALNLNHEDFGLTMSAYGVCAVISYFPGGWLADRFSARKLLTLAYLTTSLAGFYFATLPSFYMTVAIHAFWGVSAILIFWAVLIKACKDLAYSDEQGRFFGLLECGRGIITTVASFICLSIYSQYEGTADVLTGVRLSIISQAVVTLLAAFLTWFFFIDVPPTRTEETSLLTDIKSTVKMPMVWAAAFMVFSCYSARVLASYANPYFNNVFAISASMAGVLAIIWNYVCQFMGGPIGGFIADKIGHRPKVLCICFVVMTVFFLPFVLTPGDSAYVVFLGITTTAVFMAIFAIRGLYFAVIDDMHIPPHIIGSAIGFISFIGFCPDIFIYPLAGRILDSYPGIDGYRMLFWIAIGCGLCGSIIAGLVTLKVNQYRASLKAAGVG